MCSKCGQASQKVGAGMYQFIPCSCPIDKEAQRKRMEYLRQLTLEKWAKANENKETA